IVACSVVDEDGNGTQRPTRILDRPAQGSYVPDIAPLEVTAGAGASQGGLHERGRSLIDIDEGHLGLLPGKGLYDRSANATASTRDENHAARERLVDGFC